MLRLEGSACVEGAYHFACIPLLALSNHGFEMGELFVDGLLMLREFYCLSSYTLLKILYGAVSFLYFLLVGQYKLWFILDVARTVDSGTA